MQSGNVVIEYGLKIVISHKVYDLKWVIQRVKNYVCLDKNGQYSYEVILLNNLYLVI